MQKHLVSPHIWDITGQLSLLDGQIWKEKPYCFPCQDSQKVISPQLPVVYQYEYWIASIFKGQRISQNKKRAWSRRQAEDITCSYEIFVDFCWTVRCCILWCTVLHSHCCENLVSDSVYWPVQVLRMSLGQQRSGTNVGERQAFPSHQREEMVQQLETLSLKVHNASQINMSSFTVSIQA